MNRQGRIPKATLISLRAAYRLANRQASELVRAYRRNPSALADLNDVIAPAADKANAIALRAYRLAMDAARR